MCRPPAGPRQTRQVALWGCGTVPRDGDFVLSPSAVNLLAWEANPKPWSRWLHILRRQKTEPETVAVQGTVTSVTWETPVTFT